MTDPVDYYGHAASMDELLALYNEGIYTEAEIKCVCMKALALARDDEHRAAIWAQIPAWVRDLIGATFAYIDYEHDETFSLGHVDETPKEGYVLAQRWHRNLRD